FFSSNIKKGKQGIVLSQSLELVILRQMSDYRSNLVFNIACLIIHRTEDLIILLMLFLCCRYQYILSFQLPAYLHRPYFLEFIRNLFAFLIHTDRYDMDMGTFYIGMFENHEGLLGIPHFMHIFLC